MEDRKGLIEDHNYLIEIIKHARIARERAAFRLHFVHGEEPLDVAKLEDDWLDIIMGKVLEATKELENSEDIVIAGDIVFEKMLEESQKILADFEKEGLNEDEENKNKDD